LEKITYEYVLSPLKKNSLYPYISDDCYLYTSPTHIIIIII